ncbi:hypothetical protein ACIQFP_06995 [Nocardiopsis alba]|uniref:Uncharacterized protein n=1 Tax=Nocardiopsis alba TaxID=53437 RepID=A0A7K2IN90_9ACTN|nr:hypothetical protein [Nocardiopsis alba]MYR31429.1 hypothetical protein [Nocardiopsis alba]
MSLEGGPEDGEFLPVRLEVSGELPSQVEIPEYLLVGTVWSTGPVLCRVHVYDLVDGVRGRRDLVHVYQDVEN